MAWVRPKNPPKPKAKADPIETFAPLLSYISNRRLSPRPTSPTKNIPPVAPLSRDPILRSLQQSQKALQVEEPIVVYDEDQDEPDYQTSHRQSHRPKTRDEEKPHEQPKPPAVPRYQRKAPPNLPQPPPITRQKPRVPSYERPRPAERVQERLVSQPMAYPVHSERVSSRAVSARWASATTPLDLR
ncbi:MAG: hypothetical protein Q9173_003828 [Seirophora scorigena]